MMKIALPGNLNRFMLEEISETLEEIIEAVVDCGDSYEEAYEDDLDKITRAAVFIKIMLKKEITIDKDKESI